MSIKKKISFKLVTKIRGGNTVIHLGKCEKTAS